MYFKNLNKQYLLHCFLACSMAATPQFSIATSRLGTAVVTESHGLACFSIEANSETQNGLPLHGVVVVERKPANGSTGEMWHVMSVDASPKNLLRPAECIRFGEAPPNSTERTHKQLELFRIYYVSVVARNENSNMLAYTAEFCMKSSKQGNISVQVIPDDDRSRDERYEVCSSPK